MYIAQKMITEQEFNRYSISTFDFEKAVEFVTEAQQHSPATLIYEALVFAAIVCYYRPFSPNEKDKNAKATAMLKIEEFSPLTQEEQAIHAKCKELRNQALAHSEWRFNPTGFDYSSAIISSRPFSLVSAGIDLSALSNLARRFAGECHSKRANFVFQHRQ